MAHETQQYEETTDDETVVFLAQMLHEVEEDSDLPGYQSEDYTTQHATAMMMDSHDPFFIDQCTTLAPPRVEVNVLSEVPQPSYDDSAHDKHGDGNTGSPGVPPLEMNPAAPIELQPSESLLRFSNPDVWTQEARSLENLLQKQANRHPKLQMRTVPSPQTLQGMFDTWLAKRPDLPRLVAPATSGFYDEIFGMPRTPISEPGLDLGPSKAPAIASDFYDEDYVRGTRQYNPAPRLQSSSGPGTSRRSSDWLQSSSGLVDPPLRLQSSSGPEAHAPRLQTSSGPGMESNPLETQLQPSESLIPIFEVGMNIAFCENNAQHSGSGIITRIITPSERGNAYRTLQRAFEPEMEVLYEVESNSVKLPHLIKESTMWKAQGTARRSNASLNPAFRPAAMRGEVFTAQAMTTAELERHEERIYQHGYTPSVIRTSIQNILRDSNPHQHIVDFPPKDIPPMDRDALTHRTLTKLLALRDQIKEDLQIDIASVAADGTSLDPHGKFGTSAHHTLTLKENLSRKDRQYNKSSSISPHARRFTALRPLKRNRYSTRPAPLTQMYYAHDNSG
jgi:hypothetical protein